MIRTFDGDTPAIAESAYVDESAVVIGDVAIGPDASVWPNTVLRGDMGRIVLREGANVQDNATCHEGADVGRYATVGHGAIVHGATVGERALVGMNAVVLDRVVVGERSLVAAGSVVTEDTELPASVLAAGTPAEVRTEVEDSPWAVAADVYVENARQHARSSEVVSREETPEPDLEGA